MNVSYTNLTTLDVSTCTALEELYCNSAKLEVLDVSMLTNLTRLQCYENKLTFITLTLPSTSIANRVISPQAHVPIARNSDGKVALAPDLDYGATGWKWYRRDGTELTSGTHYSYANGLFTFTGVDDYVYCEMTNEDFPGLTLTTTNGACHTAG